MNAKPTTATTPTPSLASCNKPAHNQTAHIALFACKMHPLTLDITASLVHTQRLRSAATRVADNTSANQATTTVASGVPWLLQQLVSSSCPFWSRLPPARIPAAQSFQLHHSRVHIKGRGSDRAWQEHKGFKPENFMAKGSKNYIINIVKKLN
jgi:hypothetical protein